MLNFTLNPGEKTLLRYARAQPVMGGGKILDKITSELKISPGETTEDLKFTLESVACLGACGLAPVMMVNDDTYGRLTPDKVPAILAKY